MTTALQAAAQAAGKIPGYCTSGHGVLTPAQWKTCWNAGWSEPVNGTANAGTFTGHSVMPWLIGIAIGLLIIAMLSKSRPHSAATTS